MKINNTKTRKLEEFKPLSSREVKVYYCGPTVYNYAHIGNLRAYVFEDIVVRTLRFLGYNVKTTMNITDVDDKTIRDSQVQGESLKDFTEKYTKIFLDDIKKLNVIPADNIVPVTTLMTEMTRMINTMLKRKNAYLSEDGSIYFDISTSKNYGELANLDKANLKAGARVDNDEYEKDNVSDFVLWKSWKESDGPNFWEEIFLIPKNEKFKSSSLQNENVEILEESELEVKVKIKGRPGWHIECSACNMKYFGPQIDIHMGGVDNIFPHHQNEIAQTESCTHKEFVKYWLHGEHLTVDGKKMSKSANNFFTLKDLEEKYSQIPQKTLFRAIRLSYISGKYSTRIDFSFKKLETNFGIINSFDEVLKNISREKTDEKGQIPSREFSEQMQIFLSDFIENLEDDFNTPEVLAVLFEVIKFINIGLREKNLNNSELDSLIDLLKTFDQVLGIFDFSVLEKSEIPEEIQEIFNQRNIYKKEKNFTEADKLREDLLQKGYKIIDNKEGSYLEKL
ncbi:hypothetical protein BLD25_03865 [Candidatus Gracilibacteria bacterium GN02-872]|nr:hypothetical protein BLD25_03865 [Candidatus Gracilibacteria bacterium GN02-872]RKW24550.1 MAG: cysteine--tRNA ligase [Candidatus Gracilibacteria bacterium]